MVQGWKLSDEYITSLLKGREPPSICEQFVLQDHYRSRYKMDAILRAQHGRGAECGSTHSYNQYIKQVL